MDLVDGTLELVSPLQMLWFSIVISLFKIDTTSYLWMISFHQDAISAPGNFFYRSLKDPYTTDKRLHISPFVGHGLLNRQLLENPIDVRSVSRAHFEIEISYEDGAFYVTEGWPWLKEAFSITKDHMIVFEIYKPDISETPDVASLIQLASCITIFIYNHKWLLNWAGERLVDEQSNIHLLGLDKSMQGQSPMNAYEKSRRLNILENEKQLQALGLKNASKSLKEVATNKKKHPRYIAPQSMKRYAYSTQKRVTAPNVSHVLASAKSHMRKVQVIDTTRPINSGVPESDEGHMRGRSVVAKRKLFAVDNNDDHGERDMIFHDAAEDDVNKHMDGLENEIDELVDEEFEVPQPENEAVRHVRKRVRGPTRMPEVWAQEKGDRIPILVNELGQPIGDKVSKLTHFMGTLSRSGKYCPIYKPWNKVKDSKKQTLLEFIKTKFDIPEDAEGWVLKSFGKKVKNWRARVKESYYDPSLSLQEQINFRPKQVQKKQWRRLVKYWNKTKSKMVSEKNKVNRSKKKMVQVTGKKSYARVREELKASVGQDPSRLEMFRACFSKHGTTKNVEAANAIAQMQQLSSNLPDGSIDKPGPDDVFSKVMGKDRNGDAVMYGLGVRASDVWGVTSSRSTCRRENIQLKSKCEELTSTVARLQAQVSEIKGSTDGPSVPPLTSPHFPIATNGPPRLRVGDEVVLKSILNSAEIVARGWVKSLDPNELVGGTEIGQEWCEVNVQVAIKIDEKLVRPYGLFSTIQDCIGASIAWPCPFISVVRED